MAAIAHSSSRKGAARRSTHALTSSNIAQAGSRRGAGQSLRDCTAIDAPAGVTPSKRAPRMNSRASRGSNSFSRLGPTDRLVSDKSQPPIFQGGHKSHFGRFEKCFG